MKIDACIPLRSARAFETPAIRNGAKIDFFRDPLTRTVQIGKSLAVPTGAEASPGPFFVDHKSSVEA
jgi:hypothetical protein